MTHTHTHARTNTHTHTHHIMLYLDTPKFKAVLREQRAGNDVVPSDR